MDTSAELSSAQFDQSVNPRPHSPRQHPRHACPLPEIGDGDRLASSAGLSQEDIQHQLENLIDPQIGRWHGVPAWPPQPSPSSQQVYRTTGTWPQDVSMPLDSQEARWHQPQLQKTPAMHSGQAEHAHNLAQTLPLRKVLPPSHHMHTLPYRGLQHVGAGGSGRGMGGSTVIEASQDSMPGLLNHSSNALPQFRSPRAHHLPHEEKPTVFPQFNVDTRQDRSREISDRRAEVGEAQLPLWKESEAHMMNPPSSDAGERRGHDGEEKRWSLPDAMTSGEGEWGLLAPPSEKAATMGPPPGGSPAAQGLTETG